MSTAEYDARPETQHAPLQWSRGARAAVLTLVMGVGVAIDQATKLVAIALLKGKPQVLYLDGAFKLVYAENTGAFLSLGSGLPPWIITGLNAIILGGVLVFLLARPRMHASAALALILILTGGVGNLIDRIWRGGRVVDFMNLEFPWSPITIRSGIFNIADLAIVGGLVILVGMEIMRARATAKEPARGE